MSVMYRYLMLAFFVLGVNCAGDEDMATAVFEYLKTPELLTTKDIDIKEVLDSLNEIPKSVYEKADKFLKNLLSELKQYPAENLIREHFENAALVMGFFEQSESEAGKKILDGMKKLSPDFAKNMAEIGNDNTPAAAPQLDDLILLRQQKIDKMLADLKEIDSKIIDEVKSYLHETVSELKSQVNNDNNVCLKHLMKADLLVKFYEKTGAAKPSDDDLKANPWLMDAINVADPFLHEMTMLAEFANLIQKVTSQ